MIDITEFNKALSKKVIAGKIKCNFTFGNNQLNELINIEGIDLPWSINYFFVKYLPVEISCNNRVLKLLPQSEIELIDNRFLFFSKINNTEIICFDTIKVNSANEWDIINYSNGYLMTKTISSFLSNKVWAWIERGRKIWEQEFPDHTDMQNK